MMTKMAAEGILERVKGGYVTIHQETADSGIEH
jgi:hypothetical protein